MKFGLTSAKNPGNKNKKQASDFRRINPINAKPTLSDAT